MVVPLVAAALAPEVIKLLPELTKFVGAGNVKDNNLVDFVQQPLIKIKKSWPGYDEAIKKYPSGEMPDPHFPQGIHWSIPAWLALIAIATGLSIPTIILALEVSGKLGGVKEALGLKKRTKKQWWEL